MPNNHFPSTSFSLNPYSFQVLSVLVIHEGGLTRKMEQILWLFRRCDTYEKFSPYNRFLPQNSRIGPKKVRARRLEETVPRAPQTVLSLARTELWGVLKFAGLTWPGGIRISRAKVRATYYWLTERPHPATRKQRSL